MYVHQCPCIADLASIIEDQHSRLATDLRKIPTVSCGVVNLEFEDFKLQLEVMNTLPLS